MSSQDSTREGERELANVILAIQQERQRLAALIVHLNDAINGLDALASAFLKYNESMQAKIQELKILKNQREKKAEENE